MKFVKFNLVKGRTFVNQVVHPHLNNMGVPPQGKVTAEVWYCDNILLEHMYLVLTQRPFNSSLQKTSAGGLSLSFIR